VSSTTIPELIPSLVRSTIAAALTSLSLEEAPNVSTVTSATANCGDTTFVLHIDALEYGDFGHNPAMPGQAPTIEGVQYEVTIELLVRRTGSIATDKTKALDKWDAARRAVNAYIRQLNRADVAWKWRRSPRARLLTNDWLQQDMVFQINAFLRMEH
jgi:hypothetical protein